MHEQLDELAIPDEIFLKNMNEHDGNYSYISTSRVLQKLGRDIHKTESDELRFHINRIFELDNTDEDKIWEQYI